MRCLFGVRASWRIQVAFLLAGATVLPAQNANPPTTSRGEWSTYGGDLGSSKYSPLDQINRENFSGLRIAWRAKTPDAWLSLTIPGGGEWAAPPNDIFAELKRIDPKRWRDGAAPFVGNFKASPLMVGGVLYLNSPSSVGVALDAATGATRWVYNPKSYESGTTTMSARWNERGVAYWTDGKQERIFWGTGDGYLIAVDAKTGHPCADFGQNGRVDLMEGLPRAKRAERDFLNALTYSVQSPPLVVRDVVITPASISSYIINKEQIPGWLRAFDVRTGKVKWTFRTIPRPGDYGIETWKDDSWAYAGKATVWSMMSADPELGYVYIPTNTTAPDFYGGHRHGDNLFAESILCLDVETGKRIWHFQTVHHGLWDYDNPAAPTLLNITVDGRPVKALAQITKQGFVFTFDRVTGKPIWPIEERPVPHSDIPGEEASPTQPFPTKPPPYEYQGAQLTDLADFTPAIHAMAVEAVKGRRLGPLFTPPSLEGTIQRPSSGGGGNWGGAAVDPDTGILYVPSRNAWSLNGLELPNPSLHGNLRYMESRGAPPRMPQGLQLFKPPYTRMTAIDMNKGEHLWMTPTGNGNRLRNNPLLKPLNLPPLGGDGLTPGPLLTKTLLIYALSAGGSNDGPRLVAYDKATGKELASTDLPGIALGTPMTYKLGDKQYIALTVSGRPGELPEVVALALP
ncbi:MAG TPA: pyrroloquinoline quinone-dependent dehydrogenase [Bryobacteraceae bacterium]|nr:pyrroloquinoline quinone-dependent dehydrogenase [Bryobacteraceae bacterium]